MVKLREEYNSSEARKAYKRSHTLKEKEDSTKTFHKTSAPQETLYSLCYGLDDFQLIVFKETGFEGEKVFN